MHQPVFQALGMQERIRYTLEDYITGEFKIRASTKHRGVRGTLPGKNLEPDLKG